MLRALRAGGVLADGVRNRTRNTQWRSWILISSCVLLLQMGLPGCAGQRHQPIPVHNGSGARSSGPDAYRGTNRAPDWSTQAHSWGKLDAIERWLGNTTAQGYWRHEGQLQLAEGQLRFAQDGLRSGPGQTAQGIIAFRRDSAMKGFQTVMASAEATGDQRTRAQRGLGAARGILQGVQAAREASAPSRPAATQPVVPIGGLVPRSAWSATRADAGNMRPSSSNWNWITVHHSVFAPATDKLSDSLDVVRRIQRAHINNENYADIGYHFLIDRKGRVIEGRRLKWQGAHAGDSKKNRGNAGICLLGNFETEHPTSAALASLDKLVLELQRTLRTPRRNVRPHRAWKETDCPGKNLMPWFTRR